jgi:hypothetical protein
MDKKNTQLECLNRMKLMWGRNKSRSVPHFHDALIDEKAWGRMRRSGAVTVSHPSLFWPLLRLCASWLWALYVPTEVSTRLSKTLLKFVACVQFTKSSHQKV